MKKLLIHLWWFLCNHNIISAEWDKKQLKKFPAYPRFIIKIFGQEVSESTVAIGKSLSKKYNMEKK